MQVGAADVVADSDTHQCNPKFMAKVLLDDCFFLFSPKIWIGMMILGSIADALRYCNFKRIIYRRAASEMNLRFRCMGKYF